MSIDIPDSHLDLLTQPLHIPLTTLMPDGTPQMSIVWRLWEQPHILISSPKGSQKTRNVKRDPRVTMLLVDPDNSYRYLEIRGIVQRVEGDSDCAFLERITQFYLNKPYYGGAAPIENKGKEEHVIFEIALQKVNVIDYPQLI
ncbi:MAG: PPOX class F420-dependent oxidoreductase [Anaerolineae bacterium]|nr:PPOX class F420-dependent oxidoreductase [Anaerolineae bacterium]